MGSDRVRKSDIAMEFRDQQRRGKPRKTVVGGVRRGMINRNFTNVEQGINKCGIENIVWLNSPQ